MLNISTGGGAEPECELGFFWVGSQQRSRVEAMKILLTAGVVVLVLFGISKLRQRGDADMWHEVTTR
ncbi:hypothetical protein LTT66_12845 [Nocardia gipuzkoensis]|uniref:hypothetical protein n=1 Tax=Nocardia gipuzkoensis TaxID=2749991 RepID=UPI001E415338|nr:hypothetical protein [Nocardia gipuzkoensis]UGT70964.1 hypothetical protein LTT66_12845 [Nocardia gipuzkoensis]